MHSDNWQALEVFLELAYSQQWHFNPAGEAVALLGVTLLSYLDLIGLTPAEKRALYNDVQLAATTALAVWNERRQPDNSVDEESGDE